MENSLQVTVTPLQLVISLAFQLWLIIFPILLLRKINYLTDLFQEHFGDNKESANDES